jgi:hypothetical protein
MAAARRFRIGSATVVFAAASGAWFAFIWSTMKALLPQIMRSPEGPALRYALIAAIPLVVVTAIALITVNVSQSEATAWWFAGSAFLIAAIGFVVWFAPYTLAAA